MQAGSLRHELEAIHLDAAGQLTLQRTTQIILNRFRNIHDPGGTSRYDPRINPAGTSTMIVNVMKSTKAITPPTMPITIA